MERPMSTAYTKRANEARKKKGTYTDLQLFHMIVLQPNESLYSLAKLLHWSNGKTYTAAHRLEKAQMVYIEKAMKNGREVLMIKPKTLQGYHMAEELKEMRNLAFMDEVKAIVKSER